MKHVYVLRHADKNKETNQLTDEGRKRAELLRKTFGSFDLVITSDRDRTKETAFLLTGKSPILDPRTGFSYFSSRQEKEIRDIAKSHPQSYAGAIFSDKKFQGLAVALGENLLAVIRETFTKLPDDGQALIVSQDGVMAAAEKLLTKTPFQKQNKYFSPLEGFMVDDSMSITPLTP